MKKLAIALLTATLFISCSKDDNETSVEIEGVWTLKSFSGLTAYDINRDGIASSNLLNEYYDCGEDNTLTFSEDGTVQFLEQTPIFAYNCTEKIYNGTWIKKGNSLTLTFPEETVVYKINSANKTISLQITPYDTYITPNNTRGSVTAIFIYEKQE